MMDDTPASSQSLGLHDNQCAYKLWNEKHSKTRINDRNIEFKILQRNLEVVEPNPIIKNPSTAPSSGCNKSQVWSTFLKTL